MEKSTRWAFTAYESQYTLFTDTMDPLIVEYGYQKEVCPETTREHYQGYLRTARQVRLNQLRNLLPGVHLEIARDWNRLRNYCKKKDTSIEGSQKEFKNKTQYKKMFEYLDGVAQRLPEMDKMYIETAFRLWTNKNEDGDLTDEQLTTKKLNCLKQMYWKSVNLILEDEPESISIYSNPQFERAWVNTYKVWLKRCVDDE